MNHFSSLLVEKFLAVEGNRSVLNSGDELFGLAFAKIEFGEHQVRRSFGIGSGGKLEDEELARLAGKKCRRNLWAAAEELECAG